MGSVLYNFSGERFVVTGASSGMGRKVAEELAAAGAMVLAIARREERLQELKNEYPEHIITAPVDVCDTKGMTETISSFVGSHGKIAGAVHAAGIF